MKKWLTNHFLPMWATETVLADNRRLLKENRMLKHKCEVLRAYIDGMEYGRYMRRDNRKNDETSNN